MAVSLNILAIGLRSLSAVNRFTEFFRCEVISKSIEGF